MTQNPWPTQQIPKPQLPCTECRKRKLKCQRTYPCLNCQNHGRAEACLQSSIVKGTRSLKPSQVVMQEDLTRMSVRKDMLEAALAELQATISSDPHPLLVTDSQIRTASPVPGLLRGNNTGTHEDEDDSPEGADELAEALGALSIRNDGKSQYHGSTVSSEFLVKEGDGHEGQPTNNPPTKSRPAVSQLPPEIVLLSALFPFPPRPETPFDMDTFLPYLPSYSRAQILIQNYFDVFCWSTMLIAPSEIFQGIFGVFYPGHAKTSHLHVKDAQSLAVLFTIFLLGTLFDFDLDVNHFPAQLEEYHCLARAALVVDPVADNPKIHGVQTIILMIWYFRLFPGRRSPSYQWALSGVLTKLIIAVGLHRDHAAVMPNPNDRVLYEQTFWEYHSVDIWQSFMFGRPTSIDNSEVDCKIPYRIDVPTGQDPEFFPWKYSFAMLVSRVVAQVSQNTPYSDILRFDQMLKEHYTPESLMWPPEDVPLGNGEALGKTFQRYIMDVWKNVSIMYIHRRFMVQSIAEYKEDAVQSQLWYSVVSAYQSAAALTRNMRRIWLLYRPHMERMGPFWSHGHSAALVLCALVRSIPRWEYCEEALRRVDETCQMYSDANESLQPSNSLASLLKHRNHAHAAFKRSRGTVERSVSGTQREVDYGSLSPSDSQAPFELSADSPPRMVKTEDSTQGTSGDNMVSVNGDHVSPSYGESLASYNTMEQQASRGQLGQYLAHIGVHY